MQLGRDIPAKWDLEFNLYAMNADGTGVTQLTFARGGESRPLWSPGGARILYTRFPSDDATEPEREVACFVMRANGTGATQVTFTSEGDTNCTDWSPDGRKILFGRAPPGGHGLVAVWEAQPDGSGATQLADLPGSQGLAVYQPAPGLEASGA